MKTFVALVLVTGFGVPSFGEEPPWVSPVISNQEQQTLGSPPSLAEEYLSQLAKNRRARRQIVGGAWVGLGGLMVLAGAITISQSENRDWIDLSELFGTLALIEGGISIVGGAITLAVPTGAERAEKRIASIPDSVERETAAADALAKLARSGRRNRMIRGGVLSALAVTYAVRIERRSYSNASYLYPLFFGAVAINSFLSKSAEEKAYLAYNEEKSLKLAPELILGFTPHGGITVGLSLDF